MDDIIIVGGKNSNPVRFKNRFIWIQETLNENIKNGLYIELSKKGVLSYKRSAYNREVPPNFIDNSVGVDTTENAGRMLLDIFNNEKVFDYPKPISLIQYLVNFTEDKNLVVLDFFAGSGTTLHATMQLNTEDGGHRTCILCTNNENGICENVTYERNKRVIQGYTTPKGEHVTGLTDNNLRYYRTEFVGRERTQRNMHALVNLATDMLCIKEDLYTECPLMDGIKTHPQIFRFFDDGKKQMLIIYREEYIEEIVGIIEKMALRGKMKVYVFSPSDDPATDLLEPVADKVELTAIPAAIYNAYKRVLPKVKSQIEPALESSEPVNGDDNLGGIFEKGGDA